MRCPAIEGIETLLNLVLLVLLNLVRRMRCPAIEGIETQRRGAAAGRGHLAVECVAPLLRGLKPPKETITVTASESGEGRMRCPAIEGIETWGGLIPNPLFRDLFCGSCSSPVTIDAISAGESHSQSQPFRQASRTSATSLNTRFAKRFCFRYWITFSIQLWTVRRQKSYVFGNLKLFTFMPTSTVENQNAMVPRLYRSTDEGEMFVHGCCVGPAIPAKARTL